MKSKVVAIVFLCVCFAASCMLSYYTADTVLDSDASSELVLSKHLSESSEYVLSAEWYYSSELRVVNTQLIYAPLFRIFDDWSMVRFTASVIFRLILLLSYCYFMKQTGIRMEGIAYTAGLLMLPFSVTYARMVLLHGYYVPHLAICFLCLGLFIGLINSATKTGRLVRFSLLMLASFIGGLNGVRYLITIFAPLIAACVLYTIIAGATRRTTPKPRYLGTPPPRVFRMRRALCRRRRSHKQLLFAASVFV